MVLAGLWIENRSPVLSPGACLLKGPETFQACITILNVSKNREV